MPRGTAKKKKVESYVLLGDPTEDYSPGNSLSALRNCSKEVREEPEYLGVFTKNKQTKHVFEHQKTTANHKNQTSQVNNFSAFLCIGRCKSLGSLKLFLCHAS